MYDCILHVKKHAYLHHPALHSRPAVYINSHVLTASPASTTCIVNIWTLPQRNGCTAIALQYLHLLPGRSQIYTTNISISTTRDISSRRCIVSPCSLDGSRSHVLCGPLTRSFPDCSGSIYDGPRGHWECVRIRWAVMRRGRHSGPIMVTRVGMIRVDAACVREGRIMIPYTTIGSWS